MRNDVCMRIYSFITISNLSFFFSVVICIPVIINFLQNVQQLSGEQELIRNLQPTSMEKEGTHSKTVFPKVTEDTIIIGPSKADLPEVSRVKYCLFNLVCQNRKVTQIGAVW